ncbi:MAG: DNA replication/repair protein RecF, partial [Simkaniaceae bacterium]|nr:DNA replication/repair protein RecF [Simkaniaceae bacterium]
MKLKTLLLRNFRNYKEAVAHFDLGINVIYGNNGSGKTTLLEAIYFLSTGRSFRTPHLKEMIRHGESAFYLEAHFEKDGVLDALKVFFDGTTRKFHYNQTQYANYSQLLGIMPSVLFAPKDVSLIAGMPNDRRRFLNLQIAQSDPLYVYHLMRYSKAMKQRNVLLKNKCVDSIEAWEKEMAKSASYLMKKRKSTIDHLNHFSSNISSTLTNEENQFEIHYQSSLSKILPEEIEELFKKNRRKELIFGMSLIGPHRDDFKLHLDKKDAKAFSSEGQKRSCLSALRLAEFELLKNQTPTTPLMSIDDFSIHLDETRTSSMQKLLKNYHQVFITT